MHPIRGITVFIATVVVAAIVGFGIPLFWVYVGSQVQGGSGSASTLDWSVAMLILFGIIISYLAVLYIAGWILAFVDDDAEAERQKTTARNPWMRGMTDTRAIKPKNADRTWAIETVFVSTTLIVTAAVMIWFFVLAGSPLPTQ